MATKMEETERLSKMTTNPKDKTQVDFHIGKRLRHRRQLMKYSQTKLANMVGIQFQQVQKYEAGSNRIPASRLWDLSVALDVPITYFFDDMSHEVGSDKIKKPLVTKKQYKSKESIKLLAFYYSLTKESQRSLLRFIKSLKNGNM